MEKQKRERSINFSQDETNILISLIGANIHIIENKKSDAPTWQEKEKVWKDIEKAFNSASGSVYRQHKHLKLKYEALKRHIRKKSAMVRGKTGRGTSTAPRFTPAEEKVIEILLSVEGNEGEFDSDLVLPSTSTSNSAEEHSDEQATNQNSNKNIVEITEQNIKTQQEILVKSEFVDASQAENQWNDWDLTDYETENHPVLSKPKKKKTFDKLTQEKLEIIRIQKKLLTEELEQKLIHRKVLEKELEHKCTMHELEKQHLLLKIQLLKKELAKK